MFFDSTFDFGNVTGNLLMNWECIFLFFLQFLLYFSSCDFHIKSHCAKNRVFFQGWNGTVGPPLVLRITKTSVYKVPQGHITVELEWKKNNIWWNSGRNFVPNFSTNLRKSRETSFHWTSDTIFLWHSGRVPDLPPRFHALMLLLSGI